jgi:small subunit ribosomal protein S3
VGQKVHPYGFRLGITSDWESKWFATKRNYSEFVLEDYRIRKEIGKIERDYAISEIEILRKGFNVIVRLHSARPGALIGKNKTELEKLEQILKKVLTNKQEVLRLDVKEIKHPDLDAKILAQSVVADIEKRVSYKRAMKQVIKRAMRARAGGIKVQCSGRLGGAEIARTEWYREGRVPLQTLKADVTYSYEPALIKFGRIGVKVWLYKGDAPKGRVFFSEDSD